MKAVSFKSVWKWLGREGSNLRMAESKSAALPLGYAPTARPDKAETAGKPFAGRLPAAGNALIAALVAKSNRILEHLCLFLFTHFQTTVGAYSLAATASPMAMHEVNPGDSMP